MGQFYTIPATENFAMQLASFCEEQAKAYGCELSQIKVFLPTRRAIRSLQDAFLQLSGGTPRLLPIMQSIGDVDLEEVHLRADEMDIETRPAISPLRRQMVLAQLLETAWPHDYDYHQAMIVAKDLGVLIDQIHTESIDIQNLSSLVHDKELAQYWEMTTEFLNIVLNKAWPDYLVHSKMIDPGLHRRLRIESLDKFYQNHAVDYPVIVAGSTGSIPATRSLIKTVGRMDKGMVVLPNLDMVMDDDAWAKVRDTEGHPQWLLDKLLRDCQIGRRDVVTLSQQGEGHHNRLFVASEMMRPSSLTQDWQGLYEDEKRKAIHDGLNGMTVIEADNDHHESMVIALSMLEIAADPEQKKTATLITPNRYLAMRVQANLRAWGIDLDDSAGTSLDKCPIGQFCQSVVATLDGQGAFQPVSLLTALKNTYAGGGDIDDFRNAVRRMERDMLRGVCPTQWFDVLATHDDYQTHKGLLVYLDASFAPLKNLVRGRYALKTFLQAHIQVMENLAKTDAQPGAGRLWIGETGEALAQFFTNLIEQNDVCPELSYHQYFEMISTLMAQQSVSSRYGKHPRLSILGQIESRMVSADRLILSGLNEGIWPPDSGFDVWMSRQMRSDLRLPSLEQKTTLTAHDFSCGFCAPEVFITRSKKSDGQPTLPSRWLERLDTVYVATLDRTNKDGTPIDYKNISYPYRDGGAKYAQWALDVQGHDIVDICPISRPQPRPDIARRPTEFSVTEIEKWMRDPYWIYAKKILKLKKMDDVDKTLSVADRGSLIHKVAEYFVKVYPDALLPDSALDVFMAMGKDAFDGHELHPEIHGFWWKHFTKMAGWFIGHEENWRTETTQIFSEIDGNISFDINDIKINVKAKSDRVERRTNGDIVIIDYKTGTIPTPGDVNSGVSSQLPLTAMIAHHHGYDKTHKELAKPDTAYSILYWGISGKGNGGEVKFPQGSQRANAKPTHVLMAEAYDGVSALLGAFHQSETPYYGTPDSTIAMKQDYNDYAHLERISEWSVQGDDDGDSFGGDV